METSEEPSMPPIVVLTLPVCADLTYGIGQYSSKFHKNIADLLLTITLKDDSARLIFPETNNMNIAVNELKKWIDYAKEHPENSHGWIKTYTRFTLDDKKPLTRSTTFNPPHDKEPGVLRYVMPLQRAETINKINLRRNRTTITPKEPLISLDTARDHWINKQMMKKEDDFVEWKETT
ncbi:hypothetical protein BDB01DRAFT_114973 [Pilobolus umbonatus]|nr:hypothetical protein BDB01DRAFT_114973 [Pilobolus umbonatus]